MRRTYVHSAYMPSCRCPSVCHTIVSKRRGLS